MGDKELEQQILVLILHSTVYQIGASLFLQIGSGSTTSN